MKKERYITGLDIGSSKIAAVTARIGVDSFEIIAWASHEARGIKKGIVSDLDAATESVSGAFSKLRQKSIHNLGDIYVNISGLDVKGSKSVGITPLALRGREVTRPDMERCQTVAGTIHMPYDREIVHRIVQNYSIDDQPWIKNPIGLYASRLSCEAFIISAGINHIQSIYKCVNNAGQDVKELVYSGLAEGASLLDDEQKSRGVALLDMGDSLTELSVFINGELIDLRVISYGSNSAGDDIRKETLFDEMLKDVSALLGKYNSSGNGVMEIVTTGGVVFAEGVIESMENRLGLPIKIGTPKDIRGDVSSVEITRLATAIGLAKYGYNKYLHKTAEGSTAALRLSNRVVDIFNKYF